MATIVDSINVVNSIEDAPDRLRAEIGRYYSTENRGPFNTSFAFYRSGIKTDFIEHLPINNQQLVPTKKARIYVSGREEQFRDQTQWNEYIQQTIRTEVNNLDHQFSLQDLDIQNTFVKNFHDPTYEDFTKTYATNQLLNYNLISYRHKEDREDVQRIADIVTEFDDENYIVNSLGGLEQLIDQFPNRIQNYSGEPTEIDLKQRNIFDLDAGGSLFSRPLSGFPFYYRKDLAYPTQFNSNNLTDMMSQYRKTKNVFQSIKQNIAFSNRQFNIGRDQVTGKIHNFLDICFSTRIASFQEETNELFLLNGDETDSGTLPRRFLEQLNAVKFLSDLRGMLAGNASRNIEQILDAQPCQSFFIGYKVEKYLDNDAGRPVQTYYTKQSRLYDTQLKYGRRYIYKTKALVAILGSSYKYTNLHVSQNETDMMSETGEMPQTFPAQYGDIANQKYRAYVDVEVTPSFQVLEFEIDTHDQSFVDTPPSMPQVFFYNNSKRSSLEMFFSPMVFVNKNVVFSDDSLWEDEPNTLNQRDLEIRYLLELSDDDSNPVDYFTGIYEVYRLEDPPITMDDFAGSLIATVDDKSTLSYPEGMQLPSFVVDNMNAHHEDSLVPNKKYYYAFRCLTYHGTPSRVTGPFEVELQRDSDEYKVSAKEYKIKDPSDYPTNMPVKRLVYLTPNTDRLQFSELEKDAAGNITYKIDDGNMLVKNHTKKIKLRITSKHTGKKMDININLVLKEDTNSFTQN